MSSHKFLVHLEIPFYVDYEYQPFERATLEYPGSEAGIILEGVEIPDDLAEYIEKEFTDKIMEEAFEDYNDQHRGRH